MTPAPYSYRDNPAVPAFDDSRPVFIFDHVCVLCSGGVSFIMKHDRAGTIAFTPASISARTPSLNGKKASLAATDPWLLSLARWTAS